MEILEASLRFGGPGHTGEYIVHVDDEATPFVARKLQQLLIGWDVCNRGSRIEIFSTVFGYGYRNDFIVVAALKQIVVDVTTREELKRFDLPMLQVLDEEHFENTGELRLVKCAIVNEMSETWLVKPVEAPYFDQSNLCDLNAAFDMAHWYVSKADTSAELIAEGFDISVLTPAVAVNLRYHFERTWYRMCR